MASLQVLLAALAATTPAFAQPWVSSFVELPILGAVEELLHPPRESHARLLAPVFVADFTVNSFDDGLGSGKLVYDSPNRRYRMQVDMEMSFFHPHGHMAFDMLTTNHSGLNKNTTTGGVCKPTAAPYLDPFEWLPHARREGSMVVDGHPCDVFVGVGLGIFFFTGSANMSLCLGEGGEPRAWNVTASAGIGGGMVLKQRFHFHNVSVGPTFPPGSFANSEACISNYPTKPCKKAGVKTLDLYRIHSPKEPMSLLNRNLGDALGDLAFLCQVNKMSSSTGNLVTWWQIDTDSDFGQYAYCVFSPHHRNECFGGTGHAVGRESAEGMGVGDLKGQCTPNADVGSWYSLPEGGACAQGAAVGTDGCTWGGVKRLRTVNATCILRERGLLQSCAKEVGHAPFSRSEAIFVAALASSDPAKGGCPDVVLPQDEMEPLVVV